MYQKFQLEITPPSPSIWLNLLSQPYLRSAAASAKEPALLYSLLGCFSFNSLSFGWSEELLRDALFLTQHHALPALSYWLLMLYLLFLIELLLWRMLYLLLYAAVAALGNLVELLGQSCRSRLNLRSIIDITTGEMDGDHHLPLVWQHRHWLRRLIL